MRFTMLFSVMILALLASGCDFMQQALYLVPKDGMYLIPNGYTGTVIIVYDQPDGVVPEVEGGYYLYKIPPSGVLKVKTPPYLGIVDVKYFYVDQAGERAEVKYITITGDNDPQGLPQYRYGNLSQDDVENGIFVMNPSGYGEFRVNGKPVQFTRIIIGKPKDSTKLGDEYHKKLMEVQQELSNTNSL
jgi:hypothetical protein